LKVEDELRIFTPRDKRILKDLASHLCSYDFNGPCNLCLYKDECLYTEHYCSIYMEFWELWKHFEEELEAFCRRIVERYKGK